MDGFDTSISTYVVFLCLISLVITRLFPMFLRCCCRMGDSNRCVWIGFAVVAGDAHVFILIFFAVNPIDRFDLFQV